MTRFSQFLAVPIMKFAPPLNCYPTYLTLFDRCVPSEDRNDAIKKFYQLQAVMFILPLTAPTFFTLANSTSRRRIRIVLLSVTY